MHASAQGMWGSRASSMTQLYGTLLASRRAHAHMTSWDEGLQLRVIFGLSKNHLLWKIKIEINSERALMELGKSSPTLSLTQRAGEGKMRKIYVYAPGGRMTQMASFTFKVLYIGSASRISLLRYPLSENKILRIKEGSNSKG